MPEPVSEAAVTLAVDADRDWMRTTRPVVFVSPARDQVRVMLEAAAPLISGPAEALLAEVWETVATFIKVRGELAQAGDLAEAVRQVKERKPLGKSSSEGERRG
jgi:hypothetical protein